MPRQCLDLTGRGTLELAADDTYDTRHRTIRRSGKRWGEHLDGPNDDIEEAAHAADYAFIRRVHEAAAAGP
jgi:hypothetical protein